MPSENRPAPAVGQVWKCTAGFPYAIVQLLFTGREFGCAFEEGRVSAHASLAECVDKSDTYVGKWTGKFPVEGME